MRYCARPPFALERLHQRGANVIYHCPKPQPGGKQHDLLLTPLELIARIAALVPPPRSQGHHKLIATLVCWHRTHHSALGSLPWRKQIKRRRASSRGQGASSPSPSSNKGAGRDPAVVDAEHKPRSSAHCQWALLIARIYEVFPLLCPHCGGQMRLIAFITNGEEVRKILTHIGEDARAPKISPARGPPLWDGCDATNDDVGEIEPDWDDADQSTPDYDIDQRISW